MKTSIEIGKISGIPVKLHITLLIVIGFIAWSISTNVFELAELLGVDPAGISPGFQSYLIGIIVAIGLFVSNWPMREDPVLEVGAVVAIEPMLNCGTYKVKEQDDGWTVVTEDGSLSAHFEHTVSVEEHGPAIMTVA